MTRPLLAAMGLLLGGVVLVAGCGRTAPPARAGPPPPVIGPRAVLLRTPESFGHTAFEMSVAFSPDGRTAAGARLESSGTVASLCDVDTLRERLTIKGPFAESTAVAFSPDGKAVAVGQDRSVKLYDPETGRERAELTAEEACGPLGLAFSADGRGLAAATIDGYVVVWDPVANRKIAAMKAHTRSLRGVAISPDGTLVASASDGPIVCHRIGGGFFGFGATGIACGPDFGIVRLFDADTGLERATLKHEWTAQSVAFSPDGKRLASGGGGAAKIWDLAQGEARTLLKVEPEWEVYCVAFSPDGGTLAVGSGSLDFGGIGGEVRLWDLARGRVRAILRGEMGKVRSLAFAPDGRTLVTGSRKVVVLWDTSPARSVAAR